MHWCVYEFSWCGRFVRLVIRRASRVKFSRNLFILIKQSSVVDICLFNLLEVHSFCFPRVRFVLQWTTLEMEELSIADILMV